MLLLSAGVAGYYQLKQLRPVARSLSVDAAKTLVQAFVSSRLDYCNAILHAWSTREADETPAVGMQNAAARMITAAVHGGVSHHTDMPITATAPLTGYYDSVYINNSTSRLPSWYIFQCLTGQAPAYLADDCQLAADVSACRAYSLSRHVEVCCTSHVTSATGALQRPDHVCGITA